MARATVLVTDTVFPSLDPERAVLGELAELVLAPSADEPTLLELGRDADAILNCYARLSPGLVGALRACKVIARYGIGVDTVPLAEATAAGIAVTNVPDYCIDEVSDHALALLLSLARGIVPAMEAVARGVWSLDVVRPLHRLRGRTLGLLGFGRIAQALARKAAPLGLRVLAHDPYVPADAIRAAGATPVDFAGLLAEADYLSVHVPLMPSTHHLVSAEALARLKPTAILINTSRGGVVDTEAVLAALRERRLGGAALDVLEQEPPSDLGRLRVPGLVLTPHIGFYSEESLRELQTRAAEEVARVLRGEPPRNWVNAPRAEQPPAPSAAAG